MRRVLSDVGKERKENAESLLHGIFLVVRSEPKAIDSLHMEVTSQSNEKSKFYNTPNDSFLFPSTRLKLKKTASTWV
jgi:hypothetical protein